jgi:hypothetical protein
VVCHDSLVPVPLVSARGVDLSSLGPFVAERLCSKKGKVVGRQWMWSRGEWTVDVVGLSLWQPRNSSVDSAQPLLAQLPGKWFRECAHDLLSHLYLASCRFVLKVNLHFLRTTGACELLPWPMNSEARSYLFHLL